MGVNARRMPGGIRLEFRNPNRQLERAGRERDPDDVHGDAADRGNGLAIASQAATHPGIGVEERGAEIHITVPAALRDGHEAHFAQVAGRFLRYVRDRRALPAWERPNMLAKYYVTTTGTELSRRSPVRAAARLAPR